MNLKDELREIAFNNGVNYFGVGSIDRWDNAPLGHNPSDLLPTAKAVIVLGIRVPIGAIEGNNLAYRGFRHGIFTYMVFGYNRLGEILDRAGMLLLAHLEKNHKIQTFPIPASIPRDEYMMMGVMSNRHSAVCAGLAEFGWNGLALTPDAGPRVRWMPLVVDKEIEPDPLYSGPKLCKGSACRKCVDICPVDALSREKSVQLEITDRLYSYAVLDKPRCRCAQTGLARGSSGRLQEEIPERMKTVEDWRAMLKRDDKWNKMEREAAMCGRCFVECPVGRSVVLKGEVGEKSSDYKGNVAYGDEQNPHGGGEVLPHSR